MIYNALLLQIDYQGEIKSEVICDEKNRKSVLTSCELHFKDAGRFAPNQIVATLTGKQVLYPYKKGDLVLVEFNSTAVMRNGEWLNNLYVSDIKLINKLNDVTIYE